jgi:alpha-glucoside transport system permease protein
VILALAAVAGTAAGLGLYLAAAEAIVSRLPDRHGRAVRPWIWVAPALLLVAVVLMYPILQTLRLSVLDIAGRRWVGLRNYLQVVRGPDLRAALANTLVWLVCFPIASVGLGLGVAVLADRVRYEGAVKAVVFLPMTLSFTAAAVIWKFIYAYRPPGAPQIGTLNALLLAAAPGAAPRAWLTAPPANTLLLVAVAVWIWTGFCAVVLEAALKAVPADHLDAARADGASETGVLWHVVLPAVRPTIIVVGTTMIIAALKVFDIVYVMTYGNFSTEVIATRIYKEMFVFQNFGRAAALAVVLLLASAPFVVPAMRRLRAEAALP